MYGMDTVSQIQKYPTGLLAVGVLSITAILARWLQATRHDVPVLLVDKFPTKAARIQENEVNPRQVLELGYNKYPNDVFGVDTKEGLKYIIPQRFLDELKSHASASFASYIEDFTEARFTRIAAIDKEASKVISGKLNPALASYCAPLQQYAQTHMPQAFGSSPEWEKKTLYPLALDVIGKMNTRVMHSEATSTNPEWLTTAVEYSNKVVAVSQALKSFPKSLRPVVYRFLPERQQLDKQWKKAWKMVDESLRQRRANGGQDLQDPPSLLDYLCHGPDGGLSHDTEKQCSVQLTLALAGTGTIATTFTQTLLDLAVRPEYIADLRAEAQDALKRGDGVLSKAILLQMTKLDSFIKESLRLRSDLATFQRKVLSPLKLSNGLVIPRDARLEVAARAIHTDGTRYEMPLDFDGWRFHQQRVSDKEQFHKHQVVGVTKNDLVWGYGRHACPGRYVTDLILKLAMVEFLLHYDIANPEGVARYPSIELDGVVLVDPTAEVMIKYIG